MSLPKVTVSINTERENIEFSLYRTINVLTDRTGKGKTNMVSKFIRILNNIGNLQLDGYYNNQKVKYELIPIVTSGNLHLEGFSDGFKLFVFDDLKTVYFDEKVSNLYKHAKKAVFLFISRGGSEGYSDSFTSWSDAVYNLKYTKEGKKEFFSLYKCTDEFFNVPIESYNSGSFTGCLCEGKTGYAEDKFYSQFFSFVNCAEGRSNITKKMLKLDFKGNLYVMADLCGFCDCIEEFISVCKQMKVDVVLANIPSFEYMMLESIFPDVLSKQIEFKDFDYINGKTYESYISSILFSLRFGLCNPFNKEKVPVCLKESDCIGCNEHKTVKCIMFKKSHEERILEMCSNSKELALIVKFSNLGGLKYAEGISRLYEKFK